MRLVKQHDMNIKYANRQFQSKKGIMSRDELNSHIDKTKPYPKNINKGKKLNEQDHDVFMNKAFFKGRKGTWQPKMYHSSTDKNGKKWFQVSASSTTKHQKYY